MTTILTLQPNVEYTAPTFGGLTVVGAASRIAAVSDASDASYIEGDDTLGGEWVIKFPSPYASLPAGGWLIESLQLRFRRLSSTTAFANGQLSPWWVKGIAWSGDGFSSSTDLHLKSCSIYDTSNLDAGNTILEDLTSQFSYADDGSHVRGMKWANIAGEDDELAVSLASYPTVSGGYHRLYKVELLVRYNSLPVATIGALPANPETSTRPIVQWTYSDADLEPQQSFRVIVVKAGTPSTILPYGVPGSATYRPDGAVEKAWDSGTYFGAGNQIQVGPGLVNGETYYAHVQVTTVPSGGVQQKSLWAYKQFTITTTGPANPVLTVTTDAANARNHITVRESTHATPHPVRYTVERIYGDLTFFETVRGGTYTATARGARTSGIFAGWFAEDEAKFLFTNGMTVRWRGTLDDYTPSAEHVLVSQTHTTSNLRGWLFRVRTDGKLEFQWSNTGTAFDNTATSTVANGATDLDEAVFEARVVTNTNPWSVSFWRSLDGGQTWLQVGTTVTATGPKPMFNSTHRIAVSGYDNFLYGQLAGLTAEAWIWDASGTLVAHPVFEGQDPGTTGFYDEMGTAWTFNGGANGYLEMELDIYDHEAPLGIPVTYEVQAWRDDTDTVAGAWVGSTPPTVTLPAGSWWLKDPLNSDDNMVVTVVSIAERIKKPITVGETIGVVPPGFHRAAVVAHSGTRGSELAVTLRTLEKATFDAVMALWRSGRTLLLQNIHGRHWYVQAADVDLSLIKAAPEVGEEFVLRHAYEWGMTLVEVHAPHDQTAGDL